MVTQTSTYSAALVAAIECLRALEPETARAIVAAERRWRITATRSTNSVSDTEVTVEQAATKPSA